MKIVSILAALSFAAIAHANPAATTTPATTPAAATPAATETAAAPTTAETKGAEMGKKVGKHADHMMKKAHGMKGHEGMTHEEAPKTTN